MAISVFPIASAVTSSLNANAITAASANTLYQGITTFEPAVYTMTCNASTIAKAEFYSGNTLITNVTTVSGTVAFNLGSTADRVRVWTNTGSDIAITITKTAEAITTGFSGTLDTVTSTGTYTGTSTSGYGYAIIVGGGGGGGAGDGFGNPSGYGGGGGSGGAGGKLVQLTGSMEVVIGTNGVGSTTLQGSGTAGGNSTFAGMTANGGGGGIYNSSVAGGTVTGATYNLTGGSGGTNSYNGGKGGDTPTPYPFVANNIGIGGNGGMHNSSNAIAPTTGYGQGGGGGASSSGQKNGVAGRPGVLYILRF